jgi:transcriptional regulator with XRE-family HTH domain
MEVYHMPKQTNKELELFFKNARHEQKLTYEELAEKAEMSSRYLKEIENGGRVPSFHKIRKLVRALNVPPESFRSRLRSCRTGRSI